MDTGPRVQANSPVYNDVPETRGTAQNKGVTVGNARDSADAEKLAAWRRNCTRCDEPVEHEEEDEHNMERHL